MFLELSSDIVRKCISNDYVPSLSYDNVVVLFIYELKQENINSAFLKGYSLLIISHFSLNKLFNHSILKDVSIIFHLFYKIKYILISQPIILSF